MRKYLVLLAGVVALCATPARAWFDMGHMTIAAVAYGALKPEVRDRISKLLQQNPDYENWIAGVPQQRQAMVAFVRAATWADDIKKRHEYHYHTIADDGAHATDNVGYADFLVHPYWHYIDFAFSPDGTSLREPETPNALTQIRAFRDALSAPDAGDRRSYDLVWLLHLVGDAHQPLHATSRFTRQLPNGDNGGNLETLCRAFTCGMKLHAFWDGLLGDVGRADDAIVAAAALEPPDPAQIAIDDPQKWFEESAAIARSAVYTPLIGDGTGPFTLDDAYQTQARTIAAMRASLAGGRLANLLNAYVTH